MFPELICGSAADCCSVSSDLGLTATAADLTALRQKREALRTYHKKSPAQALLEQGDTIEWLETAASRAGQRVRSETRRISGRHPSARPSHLAHVWPLVHHRRSGPSRRRFSVEAINVRTEREKIRETLGPSVRGRSRRNPLRLASLSKEIGDLRVRLHFGRAFRSNESLMQISIRATRQKKRRLRRRLPRFGRRARQTIFFRVRRHCLGYLYLSRKQVSSDRSLPSLEDCPRLSRIVAGRISNICASGWRSRGG